MDAISQTTFSSTFSWMKMFEFRFKISLKFVPKGRINNIPALVQIMAWRCPGDKPLSEPMMVSLPMHIYVTRPHWGNHQMVPNWWAIRTISNALYLWWPTLEPLIWPQVSVQMGLQNNRILLKIGKTKLVKYMKKWNMIVFSIYMSYVSTYSFWAIYIVWNRGKMMVPDLATTDWSPIDL